MRDCERAQSDDELEMEAETQQVKVWSIEDQQELDKKIKKLMNEHGFAYTEGNDQAEPDTGIFMNAMRFLKLQEKEEE